MWIRSKECARIAVPNRASLGRRTAAIEVGLQEADTDSARDWAAEVRRVVDALWEVRKNEGTDLMVRFGLEVTLDFRHPP